MSAQPDPGEDSAVNSLSGLDTPPCLSEKSFIPCHWHASYTPLESPNKTREFMTENRGE